MSRIVSLASTRLLGDINVPADLNITADTVVSAPNVDHPIELYAVAETAGIIPMLGDNTFAGGQLWSSLFMAIDSPISINGGGVLDFTDLSVVYNNPLLRKPRIWQGNVKVDATRWRIESTGTDAIQWHGPWSWIAGKSTSVNLLFGKSVHGDGSSSELTQLVGSGSLCGWHLKRVNVIGNVQSHRRDDSDMSRGDDEATLLAGMVGRTVSHVPILMSCETCTWSQPVIILPSSSSPQDALLTDTCRIGGGGILDGRGVSWQLPPPQTYEYKHQASGEWHTSSSFFDEATSNPTTPHHSPTRLDLVCKQTADNMVALNITFTALPHLVKLSSNGNRHRVAIYKNAISLPSNILWLSCLERPVTGFVTMPCLLTTDDRDLWVIATLVIRLLTNGDLQWIPINILTNHPSIHELRDKTVNMPLPVASLSWIVQV